MNSKHYIAHVRIGFHRLLPILPCVWSRILLSWNLLLQLDNLYHEIFRLAGRDLQFMDHGSYRSSIGNWFIFILSYQLLSGWLMILEFCFLPRPSKHFLCSMGGRPVGYVLWFWLMIGLNSVTLCWYDHYSVCFSLEHSILLCSIHLIRHLYFNAGGVMK